jgi:hypothetical protein
MEGPGSGNDDRLAVEDAVGALLALLAVPPLSLAGAWGVALITDRRGDCVRCSRWPSHTHRPPSAPEPVVRGAA